MLSYRESIAAVDEAVASFPETFGLRAYDGVFRVSRSASYYSNTYGVMVYTQTLADGQWHDFIKGTPAELRAQLVEL